ncbi:MAG: putative E3 ubiquitin-protein ligase NEDD4 [Streblomastix strix]|uniref:HECT-type E3 ubiquitin transferase n=1 Tax=Streblomastix strix TaxID=222440 RepID=A0A5J4W8W0_9EUKA|nr:MAG: putative E3 ubiquitin-protein ligase NEDD4 [Streblomastix strix]
MHSYRQNKNKKKGSKDRNRDKGKNKQRIGSSSPPQTILSLDQQDSDSSHSDSFDIEGGDYNDDDEKDNSSDDKQKKQKVEQQDEDDADQQSISSDSNDDYDLYALDASSIENSEDDVDYEDEDSILSIESIESDDDDDDDMMKFFDITVDRSKILQSTLIEFDGSSKEMRIRPLKVQFKGEDGVDIGGPSREFFWSFVQQATDEQQGLFSQDHQDDYRLGLKNSQYSKSAPGQRLLRLLGVLLGKALIENVTVPARFKRFIFNALLGYQLEQIDIKLFDYQLGSQLALLQQTEEIDDWGLTFTITDEREINQLNESPYNSPSVQYNQRIGNERISKENSKEKEKPKISPPTQTMSPIKKMTEKRTIELIHGGASLKVTNANKQSYIQAYILYKINNIKPQINALCGGFHEIVPPSLFRIQSITKKTENEIGSKPNNKQEERMMTAEELEYALCGQPRIDVDEWQANTLYSGFGTDIDITRRDRYVGDREQDITREQHQHLVRSFWEIVREMNEDDRRRLLRFTTGSGSPPSTGFAHLIGTDSNTEKKFTLQLMRIDDPSVNIFSSANRFGNTNSIYSNGNSGEDIVRLPEAHTCFNTLVLPLYNTKEKLKQKLLQAISFADVGFGMN